MAHDLPSAGKPPRVLPLRLCEVLESEYVAVHGHPARASDWLLEPGQIDAQRVVDLLRSPAAALHPRLIVAIRAGLERRGVGVANAVVDEAFTRQLCEALNAMLVSRQTLYDHTLLDPGTERWQVARLLAERRKSTHGGPPPPASGDSGDGSDPQGDGRVSPDSEHALLNRLLLEAPFPPAAIARADTVRLNRYFASVRSLRGEDISSALCLSGGGIRSASFALGVLQGLAKAGILAKFDYLSTVSGGGYIGSWFSTWMHRHPQGLAGVTEDLASNGQTEAGGARRVLHPESGSIRFLRSYSHFLNPKAGLFSTDTWSWIGLYLRNLTLNWLVLIPLLLLVVAIPRLYAAAIYTSEYSRGNAFVYFTWLATICATLTLFCIIVDRPSISDRSSPARRTEYGGARTIDAFLARIKRQSWILALGVAPFVLFTIVLSLLVWNFLGMGEMSLAQITRWLASTPLPQLPLVLPYIAVGNIVAWGELIIVAGWLISLAFTPRREPGKRLLELVLMLIAGFVTFGLLTVFSDFAMRSGQAREPAMTLVLAAGDPAASVEAFPAHIYAVFAVPTVILAILVGMTLFIGIVSKPRWIEDEDREWWARFGAWMLIVAAAWTALSAITIFGPVLLIEFPTIVSGVGGISGLIAVALGKSSLTSATGKSPAAAPGQRPAMLAALGANALALAAVLFLAVFLAFLSLLTSGAIAAVLGSGTAGAGTEHAAGLALAGLLGAPPPFSMACGWGDPWPGWSSAGLFNDPRVHLQVVCQTPPPYVAALVAGLALVLLAASLAINLNKFSLHAAYRIRIARTFLGASRRDERRPNPFTGFDPLDNVQMHELQPGLLGERDILDLPHFVTTLHRALLDANDRSPARLLVTRMCSAGHDRDGVLEGRLRYYDPDRPVLTALNRSLIESLNRVLQETPLHQCSQFEDVLATVDRAVIAQHLAHGNLIYANRLLLQAAFGPDIRPYVFPPPPPHKLLHVVNLTLNLVHGGRLAWQERKAAPFVVTPLHSGSYYLGYRPSRDYGGADGIAIATAVAVSGAAVSPNMGYSSSPVNALLLTLFNVRLGWWLGNPGVAGVDTYRLGEPRFSLRPLLAEALGLTDDCSPYVYLSDGGHFENMGVFEMVLRRCRLIIVSDAGADPEYAFEDLANAIRKIRIDLGIPIEFASVPIHKQAEAVDVAGRYCALGRIRYAVADGPDAPDGILLCIKPAVYGMEPRDVLNYREQKKLFPQESTADQFFGESQFESYRQLGEFETRTICGDAGGVEAGATWAADLVLRVRKYLGEEASPWIDRWLDSVRDDAVPTPPADREPFR